VLRLARAAVAARGVRARAMMERGEPAPHFVDGAPVAPQAVTRAHPQRTEKRRGAVGQPHKRNNERKHLRVGQVCAQKVTRWRRQC
jgi:hypothetical protein